LATHCGLVMLWQLGSVSRPAIMAVASLEHCGTYCVSGPGLRAEQATPSSQRSLCSRFRNMSSIREHSGGHLPSGEHLSRKLVTSVLMAARRVSQYSWS